MRPRSEFLSVLRRIENAAATTRAKRSGSGSGNGSAACGTSRTTAESTAGGGWNAPRPTRNSAFGPAGRGEHHGQAPVGLAAGRRDDAIDDLLLQHEMHVGDGGARFEQVKEQRRRDVVRQVAADAKRRSAAVQGGEVDVEHVGLVDDEFAGPCRALPQQPGEVAVDLDDLEALAALEEGQGQRAAPRADLDDAFAGLRVDRRDDSREDARVMQEMLAEALARADHPGVPPPAPRRSASRIASNRLPGSARPVPARSSAVP